MTDYARITKVKISDTEEETNQLLASEWILLDVCKHTERPLFVLGLPYTINFEEFGE